MINQDPTTLFYKYKQTHPDEKDACNKLSQLPTMIAGIQAFMNDFQPSPEGGDVWGYLRIGINLDPAKFVDKCRRKLVCGSFGSVKHRCKFPTRIMPDGSISALNQCIRRRLLTAQISSSRNTVNDINALPLSLLANVA
jgi:hypothetical protein